MGYLSLTISFFILSATLLKIEARSVPLGSCTFSGIGVHPSDCEKFILCSYGHDPIEMTCPPGPNNLPLFYNPAIKTCDYRHQVNCENGVVITKQPPVETNPPITNPPRTNPPVTLPPRTNPPVTLPPRTNPPVTQPPRTNPPVTQPPRTNPPVTQPPRTNPPVTQPPRTNPPTTNQPVTMEEFDVCYGAKGDDFGIIVAPLSGVVKKVTMTHVSGQTSCYKDMEGTYSRWGCSELFAGKLGVLLSRSKTDILLPPSEIERDAYNFYNLANINGENFNENSDFIYFENKQGLFPVQQGEVLQVGYGEDYIDILEEEINDGRHCIKVAFQYL